MPPCIAGDARRYSAREHAYVIPVNICRYFMIIFNHETEPLPLQPGRNQNRVPCGDRAFRFDTARAHISMLSPSFSQISLPRGDARVHLKCKCTPFAYYVRCSCVYVCARYLALVHIFMVANARVHAKSITDRRTNTQSSVFQPTTQRPTSESTLSHTFAYCAHHSLGDCVDVCVRACVCGCLLKRENVCIWHIR